MNHLSGMEKFSHLEDKIYLTIEYAKKMREEKERLEKEADHFRKSADEALADKAALESKLTQLLSERDSVQLKIEAMLEAITALDGDVAEAVGR